MKDTIKSPQTIEAELQKLVQNFHNSLKKIAILIVGEENADDVMQESWLSVYRSLEHFQGNSDIKTWLFRIVTNTSISFIRKNKKEALTINENMSLIDSQHENNFSNLGIWNSEGRQHAQKGLEYLLAAEELSTIILSTVRKLPLLQRCVFIMKDIEDISDNEICNKLEITSSNLRVLLHRARLEILSKVELKKQ